MCFPDRMTRTADEILTLSQRFCSNSAGIRLDEEQIYEELKALEQHKVVSRDKSDNSEWTLNEKFTIDPF
jgi:hypothetical protein